MLRSGGRPVPSHYFDARDYLSGVLISGSIGTLSPGIVVIATRTTVILPFPQKLGFWSFVIDLNWNSTMPFQTSIHRCWPSQWDVWTFCLVLFLSVLACLPCQFARFKLQHLDLCYIKICCSPQGCGLEECCSRLLQGQWSH